MLRRAVTEGQPRQLRAWRKILIVVEGVYRYMYIHVHVHNVHVGTTPPSYMHCIYMCSITSYM